jgi:hypothetical protein
VNLAPVVCLAIKKMAARKVRSLDVVFAVIVRVWERAIPRSNLEIREECLATASSRALAQGGTAGSRLVSKRQATSPARCGRKHFGESATILNVRIDASRDPPLQKREALLSRPASVPREWPAHSVNVSKEEKL